MVIIPNPEQMTQSEWMNEWRKQDGTLPQPKTDYKLWFHQVFQTSKYKHINVDIFSNWKDAANAFKLINQGA